MHSAASPEESLALYREWAATYDSEFRPRHGYIYHEELVARFVDLTDADNGPVIDVGCGTGAVAESLQHEGRWILDGVDLSSEMLARAADKADSDGEPLYRTLIEADLTAPTSPVAPASYASAISAGLFTHGHVGPDVLPAVAAMVRPGGLLCFGVNEHFFVAADFDAALAQLVDDKVIYDLSLSEIRVYAPDSEHDHVETRAQVIEARVGG